MQWQALVFAILFPGLGHTALGRPGKGMALSALFFLGGLVSVALGATLEAPWESDALFGALLFAVGVYAYSLADIALHLTRAAIGRNSAERENRFRQGVIAAATGDTDAAAEALRAALAIDSTDVEAHLHLGTLYARQGRRRKARAQLRRCRKFDVEGKWDWEVDCELERLRGRANAKRNAEESEGRET